MIITIDGPAGVGKGTLARSLAAHCGWAYLDTGVLGMAAEQAVQVDDGAAIATSFPGFADLMNGLGANVEAEQGAEKSQEF